MTNPSKGKRCARHTIYGALSFLEKTKCTTRSFSLYNANGFDTKGISMARQPNLEPFGFRPDTDQTVRATMSEGKWMSLNEAVAATGLSEKTIRRYIKRNLVKYRRLGKQSNSPLQIWVTPELQTLSSVDPLSLDDMADVFEVESEDLEDQGTTEAEAAPHLEASNEINAIVRTIAEQFAQKLDEQKELLYELKQELHDKDIQLRLLPDLQKKLEEGERMSSFETAALKTQVEALQAENEELKRIAAETQARTESESKKSWWKKWLLPVD